MSTPERPDDVSAEAAQYAPTGRYVPEYDPTQYGPNQYGLNQYSPTQHDPIQHDLNQYDLNQYGPTQYSPAGYGSGYPPFPQPPQPPRGGTGRAVLLGVAIACIVVLAAAAVVIWMKVAGPGGSDEEQGSPPAAAAAPVTETVTSVVVDAESAAATALTDRAAADAADFRGPLNNRWTAQISAKRPGLVAEGRTWDNQAILAEFDAARGRYPQVRLLDSSDWPVFSDSGWWVTVSAQSFAGPEAALSWCVVNGLDRDHCFAKLVSSTGSPDGSTLYQR
ncbi:hypothetical protein [Gordonia aichiensis]|uniref:hypothetical protein n=1 Tax=Gordonia aichiensis TaxID=36820 RepID=UPI0032640307